MLLSHHNICTLPYMIPKTLLYLVHSQSICDVMHYPKLLVINTCITVKFKAEYIKQLSRQQVNTFWTNVLKTINIYFNYRVITIVSCFCLYYNDNSNVVNIQIALWSLIIFHNIDWSTYKCHSKTLDYTILTRRETHIVEELKYYPLHRKRHFVILKLIGGTLIVSLHYTVIASLHYTLIASLHYRAKHILQLNQNITF